MIDPASLAALLAREGERVEWKESPASSGDVLDAVCALANDLEASGQPGHVLLGVDKRGVAVGADASDEAQQRIANWLSSTKIWPQPSCLVERAVHEGRELIVIRVEPYPVPPVVEVNRVPWVRVGTTTRRASQADVARLQERRPESRLPFDLRPWPGSALDDLDLPRLREGWRLERELNVDPETYPGFEIWLGQRDLARRTARGWTPTATGLLVQGIDPQSWSPGAIVELARYGGRDFDAPVLFRRTATGRLADQLDVLWAQLQAHVAELPSPDTGIRSSFRPEYPLEVLKELARNLVQHRLYEGTNAPGRVSWLEDRIVFSNPGGPYGQAGQGTFGEHSDYRNPTITRHLVDLGYVERLGRGIRRVRALLAKEGHPELEVETDNFTTVTVRRRA